MSSSKRQEMIEDAREYGPEVIIREHIHDFDAGDLFRAFVIATTQRLSDDVYEALIEEIVDIFDDEDEEELRALDHAADIKGGDSHYTEFDEVIADAHRHVEGRDASGYPHVDDIITEALEMYPAFADKKHLLEMNGSEREWRNFRLEVKKALRRLKLPYTDERDEQVKFEDQKAGIKEVLRKIKPKVTDAKDRGKRNAELFADWADEYQVYVKVRLTGKRVTITDAVVTTIYTFNDDGSVDVNFNRWTKHDWEQTGLDPAEIKEFRASEEHWASVAEMLKYSELSWLFDSDDKEILIAQLSDE